MALGGEDAYLVLGWLEPISFSFVKTVSLANLSMKDASEGWMGLTGG